jgi:hypothetical protein
MQQHCQLTVILMVNDVLLVRLDCTHNGLSRTALLATMVLKSDSNFVLPPLYVLAVIRGSVTKHMRRGLTNGLNSATLAALTVLVVVLAVVEVASDIGGGDMLK